MVNLTTDERQQLVVLLQYLPELANEKSRREVLENAGLRQLLPMIDLSGTSFIAANSIISYLSNYGRLSYDNETLGLFLNSIKNLVGVEQQAFLDRLLIKHNMMTPMAISSDVSQWRGDETAADVPGKDYWRKHTASDRVSDPKVCTSPGQ